MVQERVTVFAVTLSMIGSIGFGEQPHGGRFGSAAVWISGTAVRQQKKGAPGALTPTALLTYPALLFFTPLSRPYWNVSQVSTRPLWSPRRSQSTR